MEMSPDIACLQEFEVYSSYEIYQIMISQLFL